MRKFPTRAVMGMAVLGCGVLLGCQARSPSRAGALALVKAIQDDDPKRAQDLAHWCWRPILEEEERLHIGSEFFFPIHVAAQEARVAILEELIKKGADVDARDDQGLTPVMWTKSYMTSADRGADALQCLRLLAKAGANLDARSRSSRQTALHQAAKSGRVAFVRELVKLGANVRARMCDGSTPLHLACKALKPPKAPEPAEIAKILIEAGADVKAKNDEGQTPEDVARKEGREQLAALLKEAGAKKAPKGPAGKP
jgi:ankyrin repeat protein